MALLTTQDTKEVRVFNVLQTGGPITTTNNNDREILIYGEMKAKLPFISMSQTSGLGAAVDDISDTDLIIYNKSIKSVAYPAPAVANVTNYPYDPNVLDRFKLITYVADPLQHSDGHLFYDSKHEDFILIPSLDTLGINGDAELCNDRSISISIYGVGVYNSGNDVLELPLVSFRADSFTTIPSNVIAAPIKSKSHVILTQQNQGNAFKNYGTVLNEVYLESNSVGLQNFTSIGSSDILCTNIKVPVYRAITYDFNRTKYIYLGTKSIQDVLIPFPS